MLLAQYLFGLKTLQQAPAHKSAQDMVTQAGLHLGHSIRIHAGGRVEDDARRTGLGTGLSLSLSVSIAFAFACHFFKHAIDCADVEVNMLVNTLADLLLFGSLLIWAICALVDSYQRDKLNATPYGPAKWHKTGITVAVSIAAFYIFAKWLHPMLIWVPVMG